MNIGIDIMGGDFAPEATVLGAILAYNELPKDIRLVLIGDETQILPILQKQGVSPTAFEIIHSTEVMLWATTQRRHFLKNQILAYP